MSRAVTVLVFGLVAFLGAAFGFVAAGGGRVASPPASMWFGGSPPTFAEVVARVNPAVVHVDVIDQDELCPLEQLGGQAFAPLILAAPLGHGRRPSARRRHTEDIQREALCQYQALATPPGARAWGHL